MRFWNFSNVGDDTVELRIDGDIIDDESTWLYEWFDETYTSPNKFRQQLQEHESKELRVIVDTYGGSVFAGASIYSDLKARTGKTIGIVHSKAMSAGTVILMGCDEIKISPTATMMIHDPLTGLHGNISDFEKALEVLNSVKESILNAYELKTRLSRQELSDLMTAETWMDANKAVELGFADLVIEQPLDITNSLSIKRMKFVNVTNTLDLIKKHEDLKNEHKKKKLTLFLETV